MGFKLRKSVKIAPGVKINLSKSGISTSVGGKGHSVNIGKRGVKTTVGIPGTGISHTSSIPASNQKTSKSKGCGSTVALLVLVVLLISVLVLNTI
jgi:hypothetical protein